MNRRERIEELKREWDNVQRFLACRLAPNLESYFLNKRQQIDAEIERLEEEHRKMIATELDW